MSSIDKERARFEAWAKQRNMSLSVMHDGSYWHAVAEEAWQAWQARCPEGYSVVPNEPTGDMIEEARDCHEGNHYLPYSLYRAMLAAAPKPEDV